MKTSELTGLALDWAVAKCEGYQYTGKGGLNDFRLLRLVNPKRRPVSASIDWAQGGLIIDKADITIGKHGDGVRHHAVIIDPISFNTQYHAYGETKLIAAMRAYVMSVLGDDIEIPEELQ